MSSLRETQHKRVVMLAASTIVFCLFSLWQLSSRIFEVGYTAGFEFTNREIYLFSSCTLIFMTVIVLLVRSFQDNAAIRYFEYHDKQTGLPNRNNLIQILNRHMREEGDSGLFIMIDLGRLKSINNSMGAEVGDQVCAIVIEPLELLTVPGGIIHQLDSFQNEIEAQVKQHLTFERIIVGTTAMATGGLTVGYVIWLIRGGSLLATMLSVLPSWTSFDPLPVLEQFEEEHDEGDDDLVSLTKLK